MNLFDSRKVAKQTVLMAIPDSGALNFFEPASSTSSLGPKLGVVQSTKTETGDRRDRTKIKTYKNGKDVCIIVLVVW